jgi:hypothetical protein
MFDEFIVAKSEFVKHFKLKKSNFRNWLIFQYLQMYFWGVGTMHGCASAFPRKEGGIQVLAGLAPSSQIVRSLLRTTLPASQHRKIHPKCVRQICFSEKIHSITFD